jgi:endonuclease/exonuclease/phosphatase (EEP) superfamily protein YafD
VTLQNGRVVEIVNLRLEPAIVRVDYWSPECWRLQTENRRVRRRQLQEIVARFAATPPAVPLLVGGDFNAPAGDKILRLLEPRLRDSFSEAGVGWGNTITVDFPFARIDQLWIDRHWAPTRVVAVPTKSSDHRMVIADLLLQK